MSAHLKITKEFWRRSSSAMETWRTTAPKRICSTRDAAYSEGPISTPRGGEGQGWITDATQNQAEGRTDMYIHLSSIVL